MLLPSLPNLPNGFSFNFDVRHCVCLGATSTHPSSLIRDIALVLP